MSSRVARTGIRAIALGVFFASAATAAAAEPARMLDPRGEGDPDAVTCRVPQPLQGLRQRGPEICLANRIWAALAVHRAVITPDGSAVVATGPKSEACGAERIAGVAPLIRTGNARTIYRCNY